MRRGHPVERTRRSPGGAHRPSPRARDGWWLPWRPIRALAVFAAFGFPLAACGAEGGDRGARAGEGLEATRGRGPEVVAEADLIALDGRPCDDCGRPISAQRYGGEIRTEDGRAFRFMSVECLAGFLLRDAVPAGEIASVRVVDFNHGRRLIDVRDAVFLRSANRPSPMGLDLLAVESARIADNLHFAYGGELMDWDAVLAAVAREWAL